MGRACSTNGAKRNVYRILVEKPEGQRPLGRPTRWWVNNIKMDLGVIVWDGMDWITSFGLFPFCEYGSYRETAGFFGRGISPSQGRYLHRTTRHKKERRRISTVRVGLEPTTPVFEGAKASRISDNTATLIGFLQSFQI
jgi:hypothetical protein